jgi:hypothetical protein
LFREGFSADEIAAKSCAVLKHAGIPADLVACEIIENDSALLRSLNIGNLALLLKINTSMSYRKLLIDSIGGDKAS